MGARGAGAGGEAPVICHACMSCTCEPCVWIVCELHVQSVSPVCADGAQSRRGAHAELCVRHVSMSVCTHGLAHRDSHPSAHLHSSPSH